MYPKTDSAAQSSRDSPLPKDIKGRIESMTPPR